MASLFFTCPTTHQQATTDIETDVQSLRAAWKATLNVKCPHCGKVHEISVRETYINGTLQRPISLGHLGGMSRITISAAFTKGCKPRQRLPLGITESCVWSIGELIDDAALMAIVAARIL